MNLDEAKKVKPSYKGALSRDLQMNSKEVAKYINPIIANNRNITLDEAKKKSKLRPVEVLLFYNKIGEPIRESALL
ncbi:hypothetical protein [Mangrovimonas cancribranchiae]|uniref:Uncharacterized protein n=1 Tax=Mangrovimonas cancribranchiae TaxID=3080055 RepID=A0AAU6NWW3_9FLAO